MTCRRVSVSRLTSVSDMTCHRVSVSRLTSVSDMTCRRVSVSRLTSLQMGCLKRAAKCMCAMLQETITITLLGHEIRTCGCLVPRMTGTMVAF